MKKWIILLVITTVLLASEYVFMSAIPFHDTYQTMVIFFAIQTLVLFRIDQWAPEEWKVHMSMVKVVIRLLSSMVFILVLIYSNTQQLSLVIQFIILYLIYMIFEIVEALTNLRRN